MSNHTFTTGQRVRVTGVTHHGEHGTVTAVSDSDFLPVSVALDSGRRAAYETSEVAPVDDDTHDAANGALWPRTVREVGDFADALGVDATAVVTALEAVHASRPDYYALEAAGLGEAFTSAPAGGDL